MAPLAAVHWDRRDSGTLPGPPNPRSRAEEQSMSAELSTGRRVSPWASGPILFAGGIMVVAGMWQIFMGTAAVVHDRIYTGAPQYLYAFDLAGWGWIQLLTGILSVAAGFAVLRGQMWARMVGIALAGLSMVVQFLFLPHYPIWSLLVVALDIVIIWALATYRPDTAVAS
jgi:hypothetical protein